MKHLFIVNPVAYKVKDRINAINGKILAFFEEYPYLNYDIHITRWERDALGVIRRYAEKSDEFIRVHVMGGTGTLFEAVNGVVGLPNAHIAAYPFGRDNRFLVNFADDIEPFSSVRNQVFSGTVPVNLLKCGDSYGIVGLSAGLEAMAYRNVKIKGKGSVYAEAVKLVLKNDGVYESYDIMLDGQEIGGDFASLKAANASGDPKENAFVFYSVKSMPRLKLLPILKKYLAGGNRKIKGVTRRKGREAVIASLNGDAAALKIDGQLLFERSVVCEVLHYAVDMVRPGGMSLS